MFHNHEKNEKSCLFFLQYYIVNGSDLSVQTLSSDRLLSFQQYSNRQVFQVHLRV